MNIRFRLRHKTQRGLGPMLRELAEAEANVWPLSGGDVLNMLARHGIATKGQVLTAVRAEMPERYADVTPLAERAFVPDDEIPF